MPLPDRFRYDGRPLPIPSRAWRHRARTNRNRRSRLEASEQHIGGANDASIVTARAVTIVEEMLVIASFTAMMGYFSVPSLAMARDESRRVVRLFGPSNHIRNEIGALGQQHGDEIRAVVHGETAVCAPECAQVRVVCVVVSPLMANVGMLYRD